MRKIDDVNSRDAIVKIVQSVELLRSVLAATQPLGEDEKQALALVESLLGEVIEYAGGVDRERSSSAEASQLDQAT